MNINVFDDKNKLDCSLSNPKFVFVLASLVQAFHICKNLIKRNDAKLASWIFSESYEKFFPIEPSNLDELADSDIFLGDHKVQFSETYFKLLDLWKDLQSERIADLTGDDIKIDPVGFEKILETARGNLESILQKV